MHPSSPYPPIHSPTTTSPHPHVPIVVADRCMDGRSVIPTICVCLDQVLRVSIDGPYLQTYSCCLQPSVCPRQDVSHLTTPPLLLPNNNPPPSSCTSSPNSLWTLEHPTMNNQPALFGFWQVGPDRWSYANSYTLLPGIIYLEIVSLFVDE